MGKSARAMVEALLQEEVDPAVLSQLALGKMRAKRDLLEQALTGRLKPHHRFLISEHLAQIDTLDEAIVRVSNEIAERMHPFEPLLKRLETIPGIQRRLAEVILAEIGPDMSRFPSARHLASWAGMCPGNNESAGKRERRQDAQRQSLVADGPRRGRPRRHPYQGLLSLCSVPPPHHPSGRQEGHDCRGT